MKGVPTPRLFAKRRSPNFVANFVDAFVENGARSHSIRERRPTKFRTKFGEVGFGIGLTLGWLRWPVSKFALSAVLLVLTGCTTTTTRPAKIGTLPAPQAEARLVELKLQLPAPTKPSATLTPIVVSGNLAFVSGHISRRPDNTLITGRLGEDLDVAAGKEAARQVGLAILSTLRNELGSLDRVKRVVKVLGFVNAVPGFKDQPAVINGCSELFLDLFGRERGLGARSAIGAGSLPLNVAVEIEGIFEIE